MVWSAYMKFIYEQIEAVVWVTQRELGRGVMPKEVKSRLAYGRVEGSLRRDMLEMSLGGRLVRLGGVGARRGYRVPTRMERLSFMLMGIWPHGSEEVFLRG